ncbi:MAG: glycosyltransferase family 4 protein [Myxococcales bacterium]|nr:glycosyltransferase family 4 protein [Myxococcales bacterium]
MKIGIVTEYFFPTIGGITENVHHTAMELLRRGHEIRLITGGTSESRGVGQEISDRIIHIGKSIPTFFNGSCGRISTGFDLSKRMRGILEAEQFDILHLHSPHFPTLPLIAAMQSSCPMVGTFHTCMNVKPLYMWYVKKIRPVVDRLDGKIAVSKICAEESAQYVGGPFEIIPNGVDVGWWKNGAKKIGKFDDGKINILFIGRPDTRNGLDILIRAFSNIHRRFRKTRLIVVGDGPLLFYFKSLVPDKISDSVFFEGSALEARRDYMKSSHIMCFTPEIASFGITILEGMSAGMPLIASDIEPFAELVTNEESALLINPKSVDEMEHALARLINDDELRTSLGAWASRRVDRYDWKRVTDMHLEYYSRILNGRGKKEPGE